MEAYLQAWKLGLKAVAVYRDGCKKSQPLSAAGQFDGRKSMRLRALRHAKSRISTRRRLRMRHKLQDERFSITHKFNVSRDTRATSPSDSIPTTAWAKSSSPWPKRDRPSAA
jgi:ribonucleotide reductase alpha subunit